jgi:hypothetical protein
MWLVTGMTGCNVGQRAEGISTLIPVLQFLTLQSIEQVWMDHLAT